MSVARWRRAALFGVAAVVVGCQGSNAGAPAPGASAAPSGVPVASVAAPSASSSSAPEKALVSFAGSWSGRYEAQHYLIEMSKEEGVVRQWKDDDGKHHSGDGTLSLTIAESGTVSGTSSGALGDLVATGFAESDSVRVALRPKLATDRAFTGTLVLKPNADKLEGSLQASSGDSLTVRDAPVSLTRGAAAGDAGSVPVASAAPAAPAAAASAP